MKQPDPPRRPSDRSDVDEPETAPDMEFPSDDEEFESMELARAADEGLVPPAADADRADDADATDRAKEEQADA